ncbi:putative disease resistance protein RGA1 [Hevea brasiliensis]|uniref:putative disease resistance protein RGA1 n=1 Tax=Hevea brasiliensis TaxID=3981 RepID=UPI0025E1AA4A|nr:putative disease resistance protein RGA1 [Hevea brasiliensis]
MALESFAFNVAEKVLEKVTSYAYQEICFAWGLQGELKKLEDILLTVKAVLLDAEEKQASDHQLRVWLAKLEDTLYDAEDVLDEFECENQRRRALQLYGTTIKKHMKSILPIFGFQVGHFFSSSNPIAFRFKMSAKIKQIRERLDEIASQKSKFHLVQQYESRNIMPKERVMTHSFVKESDVIGRDKDKENIIRLLQDSSDGGQISIIPIVGIGGLGKTALAKLAYNDERVNNHFQLKMWVCVSENFDIRNLTEKIIKSTEDGMKYGVEKLSKMEMEQLRRFLQEIIRDKKYLLILDDVWNEDLMKWNELKELLCTGANGSKILVTTRSNKVASIMGTTPTYELKGLSNDECMDLFTRWSFKEGQANQHQNLLKIGEEIVEKCKGVPLAVKTLASLLFMKTDESHWKSIRDSELWKIEQKENEILPALKLSYEQLPAYLKKCFVYCSFFPKDYEFLGVVLIYFWMAHGLLQSTNENEVLEDIGLRYFQELGSRNFLQDFGDFFFDFNCKMHDLLHDLALSLAQNEFSAITSTTTHISKSVRHLLFSSPASFSQSPSTLLQGLDHVRTALFWENSLNSHSALDLCLSRFQYLRMLVLEDSKLEISSKRIGSLKHLRFLFLPEKYVNKKVSDSICKLQNLQFLSLCTEEFGSDLRYLINLRFLFFSTKQKCLAKNGLGCLTSLRSLWIYECENLEYLCEDMQGLKHLRTLSIRFCKSLISLPQNLKYLTALERKM